MQRQRYLVMCSVVLMSSLALLSLAWLRTSHALVHAFDTGLYLQILANILQYGDFASSMTGEMNFLAHHYQPILLFIAPLATFTLSPMLLYSVAWLSILMMWAVFFKYERFEGKSSLFVIVTFLLTMLWHPTTANRVYFSFVPEIMALPFLMVQACLLFKSSFSRRDWVLLVLCQVFAGICKENIWLVNFMVALTLIYYQRAQAWCLGSLAALNLGAFLFLFLYWMPNHTTLPSYYAMRYFENPHVEITGKVSLLQAMIANVFTGRSLQTLFLIALSTGFVSLWRPTRAIWPAAVGVGMMLVASHPPLHVLANQYLLISLPFLWIAAARNLQSIAHVKVRRWLCLCLILAPVYMTLAGDFGIYLHLNKIKRYPYSQYILKDLDSVRANLDDKRVILADANLASYLAEFRQVKNILNFVGNPYELTDEDMRVATDVVTAVDLRSFEGGCRGVKKNKALDKLNYNYESFYKFCEWLVNNDMTLKFYPASKIYHYYR